jgi:tetratricopeptide (TPR) repeat protein
VLSTVWAAVFGLFLGAVIPYWRAEAAIADAEDAMLRQPPDFNRAKNDFEAAIAADRYYVRPWLAYAEMAYRAWEWGGGHASDLKWETIPDLLERAASAPRNPMSWSLHLRCAEVTRQLLRRVGSEVKPVDAIKYQGKVVKHLRTATLLYPSNAMLHAQLAEASAELSEFGGAVEAAEEALRLDRLNPHADKKLPDDRRERLESMLAEWKQRDRK